MYNDRNEQLAMSKKYSKPNSALPAICGPFLRYQNVSPDSREWLGSALVVVRSSQDAAGEGTPAKSGQVSPAVDARLPLQAQAAALHTVNKHTNHHSCIEFKLFWYRHFSDGKL